MDIDKSADEKICEGVAQLCSFPGINEAEVENLFSYTAYPMGTDGSYWKTLKASAVNSLKQKAAK